MRTRMLGIVVALVALAIPATAGAATSTFRSFEANATANYTVVEDCGDGTTSTTRVTVIGGHEEESQDGEELDNLDFLSVRLLNFQTCDGEFINDRGETNDVDFTWSPSLQEASVAGTVTTRDGRTVVVDMDWAGTGPLEVDQNTTTFPGFTGHFTGRSRDAVATGTVVVDGETLVNGTTSNAEIETLEDNNISRS